jgi:hypothetical protein
MLRPMSGAYQRIRGWIVDERMLRSGVAALLIAFAVAYALDLAIDASWIPEVFFAVFAIAYVVLYRTGKAPSLPSGDMLAGLGWMLILFVLTLAVLRAYTRATDALG